MTTATGGFEIVHPQRAVIAAIIAAYRPGTTTSCMRALIRCLYHLASSSDSAESPLLCVKGELFDELAKYSERAMRYRKR
jgi:hypothetical protein